MPFNSQKYNEKKTYLILFFITILISAPQMMSPFNIYNDAISYFKVSENLLSHHWYELFYNGLPWLDKPHFPFWMTAFSFHIFGVKPFSYTLTGYVFNLIGAFYTYRLSLELYENKNIAILSALFYLTTLNLILSSINIKAEAYLLGEITPATFYWFRYHSNKNLKNLLLGAFFTSLALMTKGLFTLLPIFSGIVTILIYQKKFSELFSLKWITAIILSLLFASPEIIADYLQFGINGIRWYFIESQFGRFFNTGRITNTNGNFFYFFHVFLWAFLPWSILFYYGTFKTFKKFSTFSIKEQVNFIFLFSSFIFTFLLFSATKFQLDHYTNIVFPFAAILSAFYIKQLINIKLSIKIQTYLSRLILIFNIIFLIININANPSFKIFFIMLSILPTSILIYDIFGYLTKVRELVIVYPILSINIFILSLWAAIDVGYPKYSAGYAIEKILKNYPQQTIYAYQDAFNLPVYTNTSIINNLNELPKNTSFFLIADEKSLSDIMQKLSNDKMKIIRNNIPHTNTRVYLQSLLKPQLILLSQLEYKALIEVKRA